ncbi:NADP-dependent 3-hydroxy acid dehydrogenase YdfG [Sphingobium faniae]|nr:NADP-dependent 3-hydroxy acid dehydrogenase YdfG [Sphingobium faniae]
MKDFEGRIALISGGAGGIGSAIARHLIAAGARVALADRDLPRAERIAADLGAGSAIAVPLDVTDADSWITAREAVEAQLGPVDVLISNAGVAYTGALDAIDLDAWRWVYEVNIMGALHAVRTFLPGMKARGQEGHVAMMCSITALHPFATQGAYTTSKAALLNFATVLKQELAGTAIGVSAVCPGIVSTDLRANAEDARPNALKGGIRPPAQLSTSQGMAPDHVGRAVVEAIAADAFFVFTHDDYADSIRSDRDLMLSAMQGSADPDYREPAHFLTPLPR